jgi:hypothetical protein
MKWLMLKDAPWSFRREREKTPRNTASFQRELGERDHGAEGNGRQDA